VAVLSLVDFSILKKTWTYSKADFAAVSVTILLTLLFGVEIGVTAGVALSVADSPLQAHVAPAHGRRRPGAGHRALPQHPASRGRYRPILTLRVDESLYFANARYLEDRVYDMVAAAIARS
jgi:SulP family sulfate permease